MLIARDDLHVQVRAWRDGGVELRILANKDAPEQRLRLTEQRARELVAALLMILPPQRHH
jgi:hypothetical protein